MRKIILLIFVLIIFNIPFSFAMDDIDFGIDEREMQAHLSKQAQQALEGVSPQSANLDKGISNLFNSVKSQFTGVFKQVVGQLLIILAIVVLCSIASSLFELKNIDYINISGVISIAAVTVSGVNSIMKLASDALANMNGFATTLLPCIASATAAMGLPGTSIVRHTITVFFADLIINIVERLLFPLLMSYIALITANAVLPKDILTRMAGLVKWIIISIISLSLTAFVTYLTLSTVISGSADALAIKGAKLAISSVVPVVGGIISEASETVMISAGIIKNTLGIFGLIAIIAIFISPFLQIGVRYICFKITAAIISPIADTKLSGYVDSLSGVFGLMLSMVGCCTFLIIISIVSSLLAGGA